MRLDRKRPFATVTGHDPNVHHLYEQNGKFFNSELDEVDPKTGDLVGPVEKADPEEKPEQADIGYTGLSWNQSDVPDEEAPRIVAVEIDGEPITVDMNENYYSSRDEIKAMLDKLGGKYLARDSRTTLWKKLVATAKELEALP